MTVQAGESNPQTAATAVQVDAEALASSIVQGVFSRLDQQGALQTQGATTQERQSAFKAKAAELLASKKVDEGVFPIMLELVEAMGADLTAAQRAEIEKTAREQHVAAVHAELGRIVERYAAASDNPDLIRALKPTIMEETIAEYNSKSNLVNQFNRTGAVDWSVMDSSIAKRVQKWGVGTNGGAKEKPAGGVPMQNSAPSGATEPSSSLSADEFNERQREMYNAQVSFAVKEMRLPREDAEKRALKLVNDAENKVKSKSKR
jgi:hypothetical protein